MLPTTIFLALAAASITTAEIVPPSQNVTFANNPIPGAAKPATNHTLLGSNKDVVKPATSGRCGIHVIQSKCPSSFDGIHLRSVDWNGNIQYDGFCTGTVCSWPLLDMGDILFSIQMGYTTTIKFSRQGTVSQDSWLNTDPDPRCKLGDWKGCFRQFDCGYACGAYVPGK